MVISSPMLLLLLLLRFRRRETHSRKRRIEDLRMSDRQTETQTPAGASDETLL